jgi:DNA-binding transcriptional ArsR family regulator
MGVNVSRPYRLLSHPLDGSVLTALAATTRPLTGREVARVAPEGSQPGVSKALGRLVEAGLVDRQEAGNALLYSLNRDHVATPAAIALVEASATLIDRIGTQIDRWKRPPVHASIFGSVARGEAEATSDIDLLVVRPHDALPDDPAWRDQLDGLADDVRRWAGNVLSVSEVSEQDVERLARERPPIVEAVASDAITLHGPLAERLFGDRRS